MPTYRCQVGDVIDIARHDIDQLSEWYDQKTVWTPGRYIVLEASMHEGGWRVVAQKMFKSGKRNLNGRRIEFYQSGRFLNQIENVDVVAKVRHL